MGEAKQRKDAIADGKPWDEDMTKPPVERDPRTEEERMRSHRRPSVLAALMTMAAMESEEQSNGK